MIMKKEFLDWMEKADEDLQGSMYNFVILTFCSLKLKDRIKLAFEIVMGKRFCVWTSRDQERDKNENKS
jgi:uncharacterized membrane protein